MTKLIKPNMRNSDKCYRKRIREMGMGNMCGKMCCAFWARWSWYVLRRSWCLSRNLKFMEELAMWVWGGEFSAGGIACGKASRQECSWKNEGGELVWSEVGEVGTRRKCNWRGMSGRWLGRWFVGFYSLTLAFTLQCNWESSKVWGKGELGGQGSEGKGARAEARRPVRGLW